MPEPEHTTFPALRRLGDSGLMIEFGDEVDPAINGRAAAFERRMRDAGFAGVLETVTTIKSVVLRFDPLAVPLDRLMGDIRILLGTGDETAGNAGTGRLWDIPVCYDADAAQGFAPDMATMADALGLSADEVVRLHCSKPQRVFMIGFAPGFLYSGLLPEALHLPRRGAITPEIPLGAIIVAVGQTCIASTVMPTGWYEIGRTPVRNFVPDNDPAVLIKAGDDISFVPVSKEDYVSLDAARDRGEWQASCRVQGRPMS